MEEYKERLRSVISDDIEHILVAPLNWGLGHATRCIPIIQFLIDQGKTVTMATDGEALDLLREEFPTLDYLTLPTYNVKYKGANLWSIVIMNVPNVLKAIIAEYFALKRISKSMKIDLIISDSRFGFRHSKLTNYFITHQLNLQSDNRILHWVMNYINQKLLNAFDLCIIPDYKDNRLSGKLSQSTRIKNKLYIGALSRFKKSILPILYDKAYILSGPEPGRTVLENRIIEKIEETQEKIIIVRGTNLAPDISNSNPNITILELVGSKKLNDIILQSETVVSRSGYTSIMDYYTLGTKAILIPTQGQPEQEYLARYLDGKYGMKRAIKAHKV